jgi:hypothetical protein
MLNQPAELSSFVSTRARSSKKHACQWSDSDDASTAGLYSQAANQFSLEPGSDVFGDLSRLGSGATASPLSLWSTGYDGRFGDQDFFGLPPLERPGTENVVLGKSETVGLAAKLTAVAGDLLMTTMLFGLILLAVSADARAQAA